MLHPGLVNEVWCWQYRKYAPGGTVLEGLEKEARKDFWGKPEFRLMRTPRARRTWVPNLALRQTARQFTRSGTVTRDVRDGSTGAWNRLFTRTRIWRGGGCGLHCAHRATTASV